MADTTESDTLNSPQGDGNGNRFEEVDVATLVSDTLNSPQGDGNLTAMLTWKSASSSQTPSIPRKGTETFYQWKENNTKNVWVSDTLNSPQGDGNPALGRPRACLRNRQTPSIPRKGTETLQKYLQPPLLPN